MTALGDGRGESEGEGSRPGELRGETAVKQFINLHVKSSKTEVSVHVGSTLVSLLGSSRHAVAGSWCVD